MSTTYSFEQGETIKLAIDVTAGDASLVDQIVAQMTRDGAPPVPFTVVERLEGLAIVGWFLTISATISQDLAPGLYRVARRITAADEIDIKGGVFVSITASGFGA